MDINDENIEKLFKEVTTFNDITLDDIPDIDLYMDQVTTLFEKKLHPLKREIDDKIMTKTMINNYAKAKIFPPVKSKKYNKDQIILLELIYNLKQNLSLSDIDAIFTPVIEDTKKEETELLSIENLYSCFLDIKKYQLDGFKEQYDELKKNIEEKIENIALKNPELNKIILMVLMLISQANMEKRMAEKLIDNFLKKEVEK